MPNITSNTRTLEMSDFAKRTLNPHRIMVESSKVKPNPCKEVITLQLGDPTIFGNFSHPLEAVEAIHQALDRDTFSYYPTNGLKVAREAVAKYVGGGVKADDIILTSGGSSSLELCFFVLANPGDNILIPTPSFNYLTWLNGPEIHPKPYKLDPSKDFEVDLADLESQIDEKTKAIVVNNVGNPCGNVFSKKHMLDIIAIAERHGLILISDDIYEHFVFPGVEYHSFASLSKNVPILSCSGLTKRFLMPGIRMGWICIHDCNDTFKDIRKGLSQLLGRNFGPNRTVQLALPGILATVPQSFFDETVKKVQLHAMTAFNLLRIIPGLEPIKPSGAFYMMIKIHLQNFKEFSTDLEFIEKLTEEQSVLAFPGPCFQVHGYFRFVLTVPLDKLIEACQRINEFCIAHLDKDEKSIDVLASNCGLMTNNSSLKQAKMEIVL